MMIACLCVLTAISSIGNAAICTGTIPTSYYETSILAKYTGSSMLNYADAIVSGAVSKSMYYLYSVALHPTVTAVRKVNADGTQAWAIGNSFYHNSNKGMSVDQTETNVYLLGGSTTIEVVRLSASDGSVVGVYGL